MFLKDTVVARTVELDKYRWHGFRDFGRASRPWLHRARCRDSWRSLRPTKVAGLHDANVKSLWNLLTRENAARIRKEDHGRDHSTKKFRPRRWIGDGDEDQWVKLVVVKRENGDESSGSLCPAFGAVKRAGNDVNFGHIHFDLLKIDLYGMNGTKLVDFFLFRVNIYCIFRWW